ncbi:ArsR/SmtB family transcription factor [Microbacterium keratanolyticum]
MTTVPATISAELAGCDCPPGPVIDDVAAQDVARVFKALGDPTRVKLLSMIVANSSGEMCVCDLTDPVGLSQPTVSHHLRLLADAGLVVREQRGRWAYYRPTTGALSDAVGALSAAAS